MLQANNTQTKIFLDSGSAEHTKIAKQQIGFLDGQTTNPSYFVKSNPDIQQAIAAGKSFTEEELLRAYKKLIQEIYREIPNSQSISIEVYADQTTSAQSMIEQGRNFNSWIKNAHIKLPIIPEGLQAAKALVQENIRVNMTLCFTQTQAAAVHAATRGAKPGQVYVSPFVSRLDTIGQNGFDLLMNIQNMYKQANSHVSILAASIHSVYDIAQVIEKNIDIITIPFNDIPAWIAAGTPHSTHSLTPKDTHKLESIAYREIDLNQDWQQFNISHQLTESGLQTFADDWNSLLS